MRYPCHSVPELNLRKKCLKGKGMFLETNSYDDSKMVCWKILILGIPELTLLIDLKRPESQGVWHQKYFLIPPPFFSWNIGFDVTPHSDSTFKVFLGQLVGLTQESLMLGFSNITFWNRHINWTLKTCAKSLIHFFSQIQLTDTL